MALVRQLISKTSQIQWKRTFSVTECLKSIRPRKHVVSELETYYERNTRLDRPMSPHLAVYQPQLTSILSISHRIAGTIIGVFFAGVGFVSLVSDKKFTEIGQWTLEINNFFVGIAKTLIAFPMVFHFYNGIRHLVWDAGFLLTIKGVYMSGYAVLAAVFLSLSGAFLLSSSPSPPESKDKKK